MKRDNMDSKREQIKALRQRTKQIERHRDYWLPEDIRQLKIAFNDGVGISEIAINFNRSEMSIMNQVAKLYPRVRRPTQEQGKCKCSQCSLYKECPRIHTES